jgi:hypothetical protein
MKVCPKHPGQGMDMRLTTSLLEIVRKPWMPNGKRRGTSQRRLGFSKNNRAKEYTCMYIYYL